MEPRAYAIRSLRVQIENNMVRSESGRYFLPVSSLKAIFTPLAIRRATDELNCKPEQRIHLAEMIEAKGIKTFAILLYMKEEDCIVTFRNHQVLDASLPLDDIKAKMIAPEFGLRFAREEQWKFIPFQFPENMHHYHLEIDANRILPFVDRSEDFGEGAFGCVLKASVASSQQSFFVTDSECVRLVVKRMKTTVSKTAFEQEQRCLRLLHQLKHPNIIAFLGSYSYAGCHHLLFPCLDMDLKTFFQSQYRYGEFQFDFTFYSALRGLCSGLFHTHNLHLTQQVHGVDFDGIGYHHDIRPANILVNKKTFLLADFGIGNFKPGDTKSRTYWTQTTGDYLAPECMDLDFRSQDVGRAIDIWAIGCLMADVATYMRQGTDGVQEFSNNRLMDRVPGFKDSQFHRTDGQLKPSVVDWLRNVSDDGSCRTYNSPLVELSTRTLVSAPLQRPKIRETLDEFTRISLHVHFSATKRQFSVHLGQNSSSDLTLLNMRFLAWGHVLGVDSDKHREPIKERTDCLDSAYEGGLGALIRLYHSLEPSSKRSRPTFIVDDEVDQMVCALWDTLPRALRWRANDYWHHDLLDSPELDRIVDVERALSSNRFSTFYATRALAAMTKIRLAMVNVDKFASGKSVQNWVMDANDVVMEDDSEQWTIAKLKDDTPVLVEWMWYSLGWQQVDAEQRSLVMSLRAQSFGLGEKPTSLRTMNCMGFFEKTGAKFGYGFVYRIPPKAIPTPRPLVQLLDHIDKKPKPQPLLGTKFKMAVAIADFLKQFHTVGWLHESFNSQNILIFTREPADLPSSHELSKPYFVGLHKSRPDGSAWQTAGPEAGGSSDYHHPKYASGGRYQIEFDYYSLGIILLEIGFWRTLTSMLSSSRFRTMGAAEIREEHIKRCKERLGSRMGAKYRSVVLSCLDGSLETSADDLPDRFGTFGRFMELVVEPLADLAATSI